MGTPTATGYHRPIGADPEEPTVDTGAGETEASRLTKPNHAGKLADSIEKAHTFGECAAGAVRTGITDVGAALPLGNLTIIGDASLYTVTTASGAQYITVTAAGRYDVTANVTVPHGMTQSPTIFLTAGQVSDAPLQSVVADTIRPRRVSARLAAGATINVRAFAPTGQTSAAQCLELTVRRVCP